MTNKFNSANIQKIAKSYADRITDEYFKDHTNIDGSEIIKLTETKQLNLFIVKTLFEKWRSEISNLKSPYFNFEAPEVKQSLSEFMNVLSRNILIKKENFQSLLTKATEDTLLIFTNPKAYFEKEFKNMPNMKLEPEWIQENGKFFICYANALRELSAKMFGEGIYISDATAILGESITATGIENHDEDIKSILKVAGEKIIEDEPEIVKIEAVEKKDPNQSFFDSIEAYKHDKVDEESPVAAVQAMVENVVPKYVEEVAQPSMRLQAQIVDEPVVEEFAERRIEHLQKDNLTINDIHQKNAEQNSLSEFHSNKKSESIKSTISLNQKYLFINNLFDGDGDLFEKVLVELENAPSLVAAKENVLSTYSSRYRWNLTSPEVEEFYDILKRRYS
jgi:hypothetical protein